MSIKPVHPGTILLEEFMEPMGISKNYLCGTINLPIDRINEIIEGKREITVDIALKLALFFGTSPLFWMGLQKDYDLDIVKIENERKN